LGGGFVGWANAVVANANIKTIIKTTKITILIFTPPGAVEKRERIRQQLSNSILIMLNLSILGNASQADSTPSAGCTIYAEEP
jgi:hypothetical protein